jgi:alkylated DNA repair dioxygenase AlkB
MQTSLDKFFNYKKRKIDDSDDTQSRKKKSVFEEALTLSSCNLKNSKTIQTKGLDISYMERFLPNSIASELYQYLLNELTFFKPTYYDINKQQMEQSSRFMTYFTRGSKYEFPPILDNLCNVLQQATDAEYNFVLVNLYMYDSDHINYHSDRECRGTTIASVSLGGTRDFIMRRINDSSDKKKFSLANGDLFVMRGTTQDTWQHAIPKRSITSKIYYPRINLTFRQMPEKKDEGYGSSLRDGEPFRHRGDKLVSIASEVNWKPPPSEM